MKAQKTMFELNLSNKFNTFYNFLEMLDVFLDKFNPDEIICTFDLIKELYISKINEDLKLLEEINIKNLNEEQLERYKKTKSLYSKFLKKLQKI